MAIQQIFPIVTVNKVFGPINKKWPGVQNEIKFILDDAQFTDPALSVAVTMEVSWDGKVTWTFTDHNLWSGGAKMKDGSPVYTILGPFYRDGAISVPTHVRFSMEPGPGSGPCRVGLLADVDDDV